MCAPWCSEACCICCQGARCSPRGLSESHFPFQKCAGLHLWEMQSSNYLHADLFISTRGSCFFPFFTDSCKQGCYPKVHQTSTEYKRAPGSPNCMVFLVKSFTWVKWFSCVTVEVTEWCRPTLGGFLFRAWSAWSLGAGVSGCHPVLKPLIVYGGTWRWESQGGKEAPELYVFPVGRNKGGD